MTPSKRERESVSMGTERERESGRQSGREEGKKMRPKCIFSAQAINLGECSWPDILLVPLIDGRGAKKKMVPPRRLLRTKK